MRIFAVALDASGQPYGPGPVPGVLSASVTQMLDGVGEVECSLPASSERVMSTFAQTQAVGLRIETQDGRRYDGLLQEKVLEAGEQPTLRVAGPDRLQELVDRSSGWWGYFQNEDILTVVLPRILLGSGWSLGAVDAGLGNYLGQFYAVTRLEMLQVIRETLGKHFREGSAARTLDFGAFGADSGVTLVNVGLHRIGMESNTLIGILGGLERIAVSRAITNRVNPWGAGLDDGITRLKVNLMDVPASDAARAPNVHIYPGLRGGQCTTTAGSSGVTIKVDNNASLYAAGPRLARALVFMGNAQDYSATPRYINYIVANLPNAQTVVVEGPNGETPGQTPGVPEVPAGLSLITWPQHVIEDAASQATFGLRENTLVWTDIDVPNRQGNEFFGEPDWATATRFLYDRAAAYLARTKQEQFIYRVRLMTLPASVRVGDQVRLFYKGMLYDKGVAVTWLDVNTLVTVLRIQRSWDGAGQESVSVDVSNVDRQLDSDGGLAATLTHDMGVQKARV